MNLACVSQMVKMWQTLLQTWIQTSNVLHWIGLDSFHLARIIVKEVRIRAISLGHMVVKIVLDLAFNNVKPKDWYFMLD